MSMVAGTFANLGPLLKTVYAGGSQEKKALNKALKKKSKYSKLKSMLKG